jgi:hypothetical protein
MVYPALLRGGRRSPAVAALIRARLRRSYEAPEILAPKMYRRQPARLIPLKRLGRGGRCAPEGLEAVFVGNCTSLLQCAVICILIRCMLSVDSTAMCVYCYAVSEPSLARKCAVRRRTGAWDTAKSTGDRPLRPTRASAL